MSATPYSHANEAPLAERLRLAQDPATSPQQLAELARGANSRAIKQAVARNPNTPPADLLHLAGRYWADFLENPVLPLLLLEDPGLPHRLPLRVLRALVRREEVPPLILQTLARHPDREVREGAKFHVSALAAESEAEPVDWHQQLRQELEKLPAQRATLPELLDLDVVPPWLLEALAATNSSGLRNALLNSSKRPDASPVLKQVGSLLKRAYGERRTEPYVSKYGSYDQTWLEGRAPLTEAEVRRLMNSGLAWQMWIVQQRSLPPDVLAQLARSPHIRVRRLVAGHPQLTPALALTLGSGTDADIRQRLAANSRTPEALLTSLARSADYDIRRRVGRNVSTSPQALAVLATDVAGPVRAAAARNRRTPPEALLPLATDTDMQVQIALAKNPVCPLPALEVLGRDAEKEVRKVVACSPQLPQALHLELLFDPSSRVRLRASVHPRTPYHLLEFAHEYGDEPADTRPPTPAWDLTLPWKQHQDQEHKRKQQEAAAARQAQGLPPRQEPPPIPPADEARRLRVIRGEYKEADLAEWANSPTSALRASVGYCLEDITVLQKLANDRIGKVRAAAAHNPRMPPEVLTRLARDHRMEVRQRVGSNANTPPEVLAELGRDRCWKVRDSVAYNKATPPTTLAELAARPGSGKKMRQRLLSNPSTPPELLAAWYVGASVSTRDTLAGNRNTPPELLREMAHNASQELQYTLARNPATPPDVLMDIWTPLANGPRDYSDYRRNSLASNPSSPDELLAQAVSCPDDNIASYVLRNPRLTPELFQSLLSLITQPERKEQLLFVSDKPAFVLEMLLADGDKAVIQTIAALKDTPVSMLLELAHRPQENRYDDWVAIRLSHNEHAPLEVLQAVLEARDAYDATAAPPWWFRYLAAHPKATPAFLENLLTRLLAGTARYDQSADAARIDEDTALALVRNPRLPAQYLHHFAAHPDRDVRYALLQRPDLPPELKPLMRTAALRRNLENGASLLGRAAAAADAATHAGWLQWLYPKATWVERLAMLQNPNLPDSLLTQLTTDAHRLVRAAARERQATGQIPDLTK
ncbi:hypothetical protein Q5H93_07305 [Hymenobacter sp. ASUV-10]|uniref:Leucine rich repeat variant n=1 Tax=Hymenobacter aranciens TaxID=3063996 RepID=A0ABT9B8L3_9BACT|nr:hypothetical protein [Hymenobacter sp. ASUV-10]MDO7874533.1 hypothetical protein [Hymenobacter sp. ASUV-10]